MDNYEREVSPAVFTFVIVAMIILWVIVKVSNGGF